MLQRLQSVYELPRVREVGGSSCLLAEHHVQHRTARAARVEATVTREHVCILSLIHI